jgi:hypothetical protein
VALSWGFIVVTSSIDSSAVGVKITYAEIYALRWSALLWSGACFAVGSFIGFIFGIPRTLSSDTARTSAPSHILDKAKNRSRDLSCYQGAIKINQEQTAIRQTALDERGPSTAINTNLEQISDWLTKIIVSVSLVNSGQIGDNILRAAGKWPTRWAAVPTGNRWRSRSWCISA